MISSLSDSDRASINAVVQGLEQAWNQGDGEAFAAAFTADADFVNVRAEHHVGRAAIAGGHNAIFRTIYAGSRVSYAVRTARLLRDDVALAHVGAQLHVPTGPLAGRIDAFFSIVLLKSSGGWQIAAFQNTPVPEAH